ncbi:LOW QUALITY PROTEIN: ABC transporter [Cinnamomum micranthum f. kanehirae]|uniref:ABC transporter n=1 Tax=Cinnamomum micranthum f. kanehirae TaxID=337451 RepID=A0A3S3NT56_9MAGN|nr:LOW QUALITY PROTEIN: ABC transporter [Cinnamomum micranthum f. kanehirae]
MKHRMEGGPPKSEWWPKEEGCGALHASWRRTIVLLSINPAVKSLNFFHNLCLLSAGRQVVFWVAAAAANEFFAVNGFPCPSLRNPSDHYLRTINKGLRSGPWSHTNCQAIDILVKSYKRRALDKKEAKPASSTQSLVLTRRSYVNMDLGYYGLRLAIYIALCLCVAPSTMTLARSYGSIQARINAYTKRHYAYAAFVVGNHFLPFLTCFHSLYSLEPLPTTLLAYQRGIDLSYSSPLGYYSVSHDVWLRALMIDRRQFVPDFLMGIITGAGIQGSLMLNGGFFRLPDDLPSPSEVPHVLHCIPQVC